MNSISGLLLNARSIRSKQRQLEAFMELHPMDMVCITETWMTGDDTDFLSHLPGYSSFRHDRNSRGGGIMAIVKDTLLPMELDALHPTDIELMWLTLTAKHSKWLVGLVYRPPNSDISFLQKLQDACDRVQAYLPQYEGLLLLGDFNINWQADVPSKTNLNDVTNSIGLTQIVEDVTRPSGNSSSTGSTIDLIFTNQPEKFSVVESFPNPVSSDHHAVHFSFSALRAPPQPAVVRSFLQYRKADMSHLETLLHLAPWTAFMDTNNPDASWEGFMDIFEAAIHDSIPRKQCRRNKISPWISPELKKLILLKRKLFIKAKRSGNSSIGLPTNVLETK